MRAQRKYQAEAIVETSFGLKSDSEGLLTPDDMDDSADSDWTLTPNKIFEETLLFAVRIYKTVIRHVGDANTLPFIHTMLVFLDHMTRYPDAIEHLEDGIPWKLTAMMLNFLLSSCRFQPHGEFPGSRPLPEDFAMRGLLYVENYFHESWFKGEIDESMKCFELGSSDDRKERILHLGYKIASLGKWLTWDARAREFAVMDKYDEVLEDIPREVMPDLRSISKPLQFDGR